MHSDNLSKKRVVSGLARGFLRLIYTVTGWKTIEEDDGIFIIRRGSDTLVKVGSTTYSVINKDHIYTNSYYDYFIPLAYLYNRPKVLAIGVGGGTVFLQLSRLLGKNVDLYGVDTSAKMVKFARKYFIGDVGAKISIDDGAAFITRKKNAFDLIILDAYRGMSMPKQFLEDDFIMNANKSLRVDGIMAINTILSSLELKEYIQKLRRFFKVYELQTSSVGLNVMLVCSKRLDNNEIREKISSKMPKNKENKFLFDRYSNL
jgi:spermidine synthase